MMYLSQHLVWYVRLGWPQPHGRPDARMVTVFLEDFHPNPSMVKFDFKTYFDTLVNWDGKVCSS